MIKHRIRALGYPVYKEPSLEVTIDFDSGWGLRGSSFQMPEST
jgi:hypothetical protein